MASKRVVKHVPAGVDQTQMDTVVSDATTGNWKGVPVVIKKGKKVKAKKT